MRRLRGLWARLGGAVPCHAVPPLADAACLSSRALPRPLRCTAVVLVHACGLCILDCASMLQQQQPGLTTSVEVTQHHMARFQEHQLPHQQWPRRHVLDCLVLRCLPPAERGGSGAQRRSSAPGGEGGDAQRLWRSGEHARCAARPRACWRVHIA